jgi:O-succinylbenzoic acid--CoA ligase
VVVVGVPDPEWGSLLTAVVTGSAELRALRDAVGGGPHAPRALVRVDEIPTRGPGKPDRLAAADLAAAAIAEGTAERL